MKEIKKILPELQLDLITIISISIAVFVIQNVLHEFVGHGGATFLVGGKIISLTTAYLENDLDTVTSFGKRIVAAAGPIVNILVGLLAWLFLKIYNQKPNSITFFLWLTMTVNLFTGTGYFFFSGFSGIGDWVNVIDGVTHLWAWRIGMIFIGVITYLGSIIISLKELSHFLSNDLLKRNKEALRLSLIPYLAGSIASTIGAVFNPISIFFVLTSAASTFGGTSGLAWMTQLYSTKWFSNRENRPIKITRSWFWILLSMLFLLIHVFLIGPGINF